MCKRQQREKERRKKGKKPRKERSPKGISKQTVQTDLGIFTAFIYTNINNNNVPPPDHTDQILYTLRTYRALVSCTRQGLPPGRNRCPGRLPPTSPSSSAISNCCSSTTTRIGPTSPSGRCRPRRTTSASESRLWNGRCIICAPSGIQILHRMYVVLPPFLCETCQLSTHILHTPYTKSVRTTDRTVTPTETASVLPTS